MLVAVLSLGVLAQPLLQREDAFAEEVAPVLVENCIDCHGGPTPKADLDLSAFRSGEQAQAAPGIFQGVRERVRAGEMPPGLLGPLPEAQRRALLGWIDEHVELPAKRVVPEAVRLRRLNRDEYRFTVLDLLGVEAPVEEWFPPETPGHGFDTAAGTQTLSPRFLEASLRAAEWIADAAIACPEAYEPARVTVRSGELETPGQIVKKGGRALFPPRHRAIGRVTVERRGSYRIHVLAGARRSAGIRTLVALSIDDGPREAIEVGASDEALERYTFDRELAVGHHNLGIHFEVETGGWEASEAEASPVHELAVESLVLEGPLEPPPLPGIHQRLRDTHPDPGSAVRALVRRAWRRPGSDAELERLLSLSGEEADWEERVRTALVGLLASPHFLLRAEGVYGSEWALASRLSYFLWSSAPDERLLALAATGLLARSVPSELERMLADARSTRFARRFALQWLQLERLNEHVPDPRRFPRVDDSLLAAMREETQLFFEAVLREGRSVGELLDSDFTFANDALAGHYGIPGIRGEGFVRVGIPRELREQRGGLLGQASVLTATSNPTRTSPVLRGKWVLDVLLGTPPAPPPPGVGNLAAESSGETELSLRERLERHREEGSCAVCHEAMDGLGFGLENYDAVGAWRTEDGSAPLETSGRLVDGRTFTGPAPLRAILARDPRFHRALVLSLARYALGRGLEPEEREELVAGSAALSFRGGAGPRLSDLLLLVCGSRAFLHADVPTAVPSRTMGELR